jgi:4'-phosphopantetheinyl transferase
MKPFWNTPPAQLLLLSRDVHIWRASLDLPGKSVQELKGLLSSDEMRRAENFRFDRDRSLFVAARGILRLILASYLSIEPSAIRFCYEKEGKPRLQNDLGNEGIQFNLTHSEGLGLYVFARGHEAGIDVEHVREISEMEQIVEQFFLVRERVYFSALPACVKRETFFKWWARKEAYMKATGEGLLSPLDRCDALLIEEISGNPSKISRDVHEGPQWSMWDVRPAEEFAGAVVVEGEGWNVRYWQWPG